MNWFKHFTDAHHNSKIQWVCDELGADAGYARIFKLYEVVARRWEDRKSDPPLMKISEGPTNFKFFSKIFGISVTEVEKTFCIFAKAGIIDRTAWKKKVVYIPQLREYSNDWFKRAKTTEGHGDPPEGLQRDSGERIEESRIEENRREEEEMRKENYRIACLKIGLKADPDTSGSWRDLKEMCEVYGDEEVLERFNTWLSEKQGGNIRFPISIFVKDLPTLIEAPGLTKPDEALDNLAIELYNKGGAVFSGKDLTALGELRKEFTDKEILQAWQLFTESEAGSYVSNWPKKFTSGGARILIKTVRADTIRREQLEKESEAAIEKLRVEDRAREAARQAEEAETASELDILMKELERQK